MNKLLKKLEKSQKNVLSYYEAIIKQRDTAKSKILFTLLDGEVTALDNLTKSFERFASLLRQKIQADTIKDQKRVSDSIEFIKTMSDNKQALEMIEFTQKYHNLHAIFAEIDYTLFKNSLKLYLSASKRDSKKWKIFKEFTEISVPFAIDTLAFPFQFLGLIKFAFDAIRNLITLSNLSKKLHPDLGLVDQELYLIEKHTVIMEITAKHFQESAENLEKILSQKHTT